MKRGFDTPSTTQYKRPRVEGSVSTMHADDGRGDTAQVRYKSVYQNAGGNLKRKIAEQQTSTVVWQGRWIGSKAMHELTAVKGCNGGNGDPANTFAYGNIPLAYGNFSSVSAGYRTVTALFIDVTRVPNVIDTSGTIRSDLNMFQPHIDGTGAVTLVDLPQSYVSLTGRNECYAPLDRNGAPTRVWQPFFTSRASNSVLACPGPRAILDSVELKLEAYGAGKRQIKYAVGLVQFDDKIAPDFEAQSTPSNRVYANSSPQAQFWNEFARRINYHPWAVGYGPMDQMKILPGTWMDHFDIAPTQNTDGDNEPQSVLKKYFYKLNRRCEFIWGGNSGADVALGNPGLATNNGDTQKMTVEPKARVYLMIMCHNYKASTLADFTGATPYDYIPSIGMDVKTRWKINA